MTGEQLVNGEWTPGSGPSFTSINPFSTETFWEGASSQSSDVDAAIAASRVALGSWSRTPIEERVAVVERFRDHLRAHAEAFADAITHETGKARWETIGEVNAMAAKADISVAAYHERTGTIERAAGSATSVTRHKPHGVLVVFGAYNFPGHLPNGHIIPALLAGNTVVFKPSELSPGVGELAVRLWDAVGLPPGVINLVQGGRDTGAALVAHPGMDGLLFTGSASTGAYLHEQFAGRPDKILALEMGGNNPLVFADATDTEAAVTNAVQSAFITSGQRCTCARRLMVPLDENGDNFLDALVDATERVPVGDPMGDVYMGPVISAHAATQLLDGFASIVRAGADPLVPMRHIGSAMVSPSIVDATGLSLPDEEHFGPLLTVYRYRSFDEAIALANDTAFGLAAGIFTSDRSMYEQFWAEARAGIVNWNRPLTGASSAAPFGGIGASGNHRPAAYYAADYVAYPVASLEAETLESITLPGM